MNHHKYRIGQSRSQLKLARYSSILAIAFLVTVGNVSANQTPTASDEDSNAVIHGPTPGTSGHEGILGLDPWTVVSPTPVPVSRPGGTVLDGLFYVIGGEETGAARNGHVQIYDPETDVWDAVSADPMPIPASNLCVAAVDGLIYVPGGWDGTALTPLQVFDPAAGTWVVDVDDPMPAGRHGSACVEHQGKLYVFGGWDSTTATSTAWVYDPQASLGNRWSTLSNSTFSHVYGAAVSASNGLIFVAGISDNAFNDFDTVAAYDPLADDWTAYPGLQTARGGAAAWTRGDFLYVGGGGWSSYLTTVESYDLTQGTSGSWTFTGPLNVGRRTFAFGTDPVNGELFAAAGWAGAFLDSAEVSAGPIIPVVLSISPDSGPAEGGTLVTISGDDFDMGAQVLIGGVDCLNVNVVDVNTISCETPPGALGLADVTVINPDTASGTLADGFTYLGAPELDIVPAFGSLLDLGSGGSGDLLTETITADNVGNADLELNCTLSDNAGGVFSLLPSDPISITLEPTDAPANLDIQCNLPTLAPGASETYSGELTCTTNDPNFPGDNNFGLVCAGSGGTVTAVPTLGRWSLLTLILGLLLMAGFGLRANRRS